MTSTLWTTPWRWRTPDGVYVSWTGSVWLYRTFPVNPTTWEDDRRRLELGYGLQRLLEDLGATSKSITIGPKQITTAREFHLVSTIWEKEELAPAGTPDSLADFLNNDVLGFLTPRKALMVGVRLRPTGAATADQSVMDTAKRYLSRLLGEEVPDLDAYERDLEEVVGILNRNGCRRLSTEEADQLESWYNRGAGTDCMIIEEKDHVVVSTGDGDEKIEMAALRSFEQTQMRAPIDQWMLDMQTHIDGPEIVSIRGVLEPATSVRQRVRRSQRKMLAQMEEEAATGDLERVEYSSTYELAKGVEDYIVAANQPLLSQVSVVMGCRTPNSDMSYIDHLRDHYGIMAKPLEMRQLDSVDHTLPGSAKQVNPFLQDLNIAMVAYSGAHGFSSLGDHAGVYLGLVHPDFTATYMDPLGAPRRNLPPITAVFGDPGSGKTFLAQSVAFQSVLAGLPVVFINPKGFDSLAGLADVCGGEVVSMSKLTKRGGAFDPFRYAARKVDGRSQFDPEAAADILATHVLDVLGDAFDRATQIDIRHGILQGAVAGARCAKEAIDRIEDARAKELIFKEAASNPLFGLGIGMEPQPRFNAIDGLTLIEFDRQLPLPDPSKTASTYSAAEISALAAVRLVTRASVEILTGIGDGGVLVLDEAHIFMSHPESLASIQNLGRLGRSLNLLPLFLTQRCSDLLDRDMENYLSRVLCLKMSDPTQAAAALTLCGLEPTESRIEWLRSCGPKPAEGEKPAEVARGIMRDLYNRHAAVWLTPTPDWLASAFSTNPDDRKARLDEQLAGRRSAADTTPFPAAEPAQEAAPTPVTGPAWPAPEPAPVPGPGGQTGPVSPPEVEVRPSGSSAWPGAAPAVDRPDAPAPAPDVIAGSGRLGGNDLFSPPTGPQ